MSVSSSIRMNEFGSMPNTLIETAWDTVNRDLLRIFSNLTLVVFLNPFGDDPGKALRDWGLCEPFFFIVFLGLVLPCNFDKDKANVHIKSPAATCTSKPNISKPKQPGLFLQQCNKSPVTTTKPSEKPCAHLVTKKPAAKEEKLRKTQPQRRKSSAEGGGATRGGDSSGGRELRKEGRSSCRERRREQGGGCEEKIRSERSNLSQPPRCHRLVGPPRLGPVRYSRRLSPIVGQPLQGEDTHRKEVVTPLRNCLRRRPDRRRSLRLRRLLALPSPLFPPLVFPPLPILFPNFKTLNRRSPFLRRRSQPHPAPNSREIQTAVRLVLPGELAKHAVSEGTKATTKFTKS
ncbi:hypothetical protein Droror1_Dr00000695 [Drosera rotundifolia]